MGVGDLKGTVQQLGVRIPKTQWTQVERASQDTPDGRQAMGHLLQCYLPALRAHLIGRRGVPADKADDLLQSFIERRILEQQLLAKADRSRRCKFRSFLLTALDHFVTNEVAREHAKKRSSRLPVRNIDAYTDTIPSRAARNEFDVVWAQQVIDQTLKRMHAQCVSTGRPDVWQLFEQQVLRPVLYGEMPVAYKDVVTRLGYRSPIQASNVVITAKRLFQRILRQVIGDYAAGASDVEREIDDLLRSLSIARAE